MALSPGANPSERIDLIPKFVTGQSFRYQIETRTTTTSNTTTPVVNPEAPSQLKQVSDLQLRLDVLDAQSGSGGELGTVRLRVTYEKAGATTESDAYDPAADVLEDQYNRLQGRSVEFTIEPTGEVSKITGLDDVYSNPAATATVRAWLNALSASAKLPHEGIAIGQKWNNERRLENTPLAGLISRTESTYLRDEPCESQAKPTPTGAPAAKDAASCAMVLTRFEILRKGSTEPHATPDDYRHTGCALRHMDRRWRKPRRNLIAKRHDHALDPNLQTGHGLRDRQRAFRLENALRRSRGKPIRGHPHASDRAGRHARTPIPPLDFLSTARVRSGRKSSAVFPTQRAICVPWVIRDEPATCRDLPSIQASRPPLAP